MTTIIMMIIIKQEKYEWQYLIKSPSCANVHPSLTAANSKFLQPGTLIITVCSFL